MSHIDDLRSHELSYSWIEGLANGTLVSVESTFALASGVSNSIAFTTGPLPVIIQGNSLSTNSIDSTAQIFEGGAYSGGVALAITDRNRSALNPVTTISNPVSGAIIDTAGIQIAFNDFIGAKNTVAKSAQTQPILVLKPNMVYYWTITSNDSGTDDYDVGIDFSQLI